MQAIRVHQPGGPEVLQLENIPTPDLAPGQVMIQTEAIGVNFVDIYGRRGVYPHPMPWIPGVEAAGVITQVHPDVRLVAPGDRVAFTSAPHAYAQWVAVPEDQVVPIPPSMDSATAAAALLQGMTAHYLSHDTYPIQAGDIVLVHAGAGGVGQLLTQMAKTLQATVITTVSNGDKARTSYQCGADHVIEYTGANFSAEVMRYTQGRGVQAVYDSVGATTFDHSLNILAPLGYLVLFGQSSGSVAPFELSRLAARSLFVTRPTLPHYTATRAALLDRAQAVFSAISDGSLRIAPPTRWPLADAAQAHRALESRQTSGKLLLLP